ncbi:MAG: IclR family transcriptional regulator [Hyphomicrobiaceae bacterium]
MTASVESDRSVRVIMLLNAVAEADAPITANELSERIGMPKATVYRLCDQLSSAGLIRRHLGGRGFEPGQRLFDLAQTILSSRAAHVLHHAVLTRVARTIGETCNLVVPEGVGMVYLDRVETEWPLRLQLPVGSRVPVHATASGKMYLASLDSGQRACLLRELELSAFTERTMTSPGDLDAHLSQVSEQGYSLDDEEFILGMTAVAVPVRDKSGRFLASLAVHAPKSRMPLSTARTHVELLYQAAAQIGQDVIERKRARAKQAYAGRS